MSLIGKALIKFLNQFSYVRELNDRISQFEKYSGFPQGHYYNPLADPEEYTKYKHLFCQVGVSNQPEICFNEEEQKGLLEKMKSYFPDFPYDENASGKYRFKIENDFFSGTDALHLYAIIRLFKPERILEIGSGYSSALLLDINDQYFENRIQLTFIDPHPERLLGLIRPHDRLTLLKNKIQDMDTRIFEELSRGDVLLIDTSHVTKSGGDVNHIFFNILPRLQVGVKIHIHDIFYPFEYPDRWIVEERRSWNEVYLLRAFLAYNDSFKIIWFNSYMEKMYPELSDKRPDRVYGGIWLEKIK